MCAGHEARPILHGRLGVLSKSIGTYLANVIALLILFQLEHPVTMSAHHIVPHYTV